MNEKYITSIIASASSDDASIAENKKHKHTSDVIMFAIAELAAIERIWRFMKWFTPEHCQHTLESLLLDHKLHSLIRSANDCIF